MNVHRVSRRRDSARTALGSVLCAVLLMAVCAAPASAQMPFGFHPGTFSTTVSTPQAGAHPDFTTSFEVAQDTPYHLAAGTLKDFELDLPPGMLGNPAATPRCTMGRVMAATSSPCPIETAVGSVQVTFGYAAFPGFALTNTSLLYNVQPQDDEPAAFGFNAIINGRVGATVRSDGDYGITAKVANATEYVSVFGVRVTMWGVPTDHHGPGLEQESSTLRFFGGPGTGPRRAFLSNPTACGDAASPTHARLASWQEPGRPARGESSLPATTGCDKLQFEPKVKVRPDTTAPGAPAGYTVDVDVPQNENPDALETAHLKNAKVTLPEGVTLSPSVAHGLQACTNDQVGLKKLGPPSCPDGSKIGTLAITTPVLPDPLTGNVYIGEPLPGNRYRIFLTASGFGVDVKLEGRVSPNQETGQLTATFLDNPQLPFTNFHLEFNGGPQAPLANPTTCGVKTTTSELTSWAGHSRDPSDSFEITGCPARTFAPTWSVGTTNPVAGADTAFTMRVTRNDNDHEIDSINADLPPGLLGRISRVRPCSAAQAQYATCDASSQIGTTTVGAGPGPSPFYLKGRVYLTEGYKGAPYGLAFVVPAVAGPYDLGIVNVRAGIFVDRDTAELSVVSDPLPRILDGIPLRVKDIRIDIDRPGFMMNPTSCAPTQILGRVNSVVPGVVASVANRFQVGECAALPFAPDLSMTLSGKGDTTDGKRPTFKATLKQSEGQAGIGKAAVTLPLSLALDPDNAQSLCKPQEAAARACPPGSIVGTATAVTPVLTKPLTGPVYFVEGLRRTRTGAIRRTFPKLWIPLKGEVELDLRADTDTVDDKLVTSFASIPDAPISSFELTINGGKNGVLVISDADVCAANQQATGDYTGQNGKTIEELAAQITPLNCPTKIVKATQAGQSVKLTVGGLRNGGQLTARGDDVKTTRRTLKSANAANLTVPLDDAARRELTSNGRLEVKVSVDYRAPGAKRAKRRSTTVTLKHPAPAANEEGETAERRRR